MGEVTIRKRPIAYEVTIWPEDADHIDGSIWAVSVVFRGHGKWAVVRGTDGGGPAFSASLARWEREPLPSSRDDEWLADHRFDLERALEIATWLAPQVTINGLTAYEAMTEWQQRQTGEAS